jgi:hypothetical protein
MNGLRSEGGLRSSSLPFSDRHRLRQEALDFCGDDGEATAFFSNARGFDGGREGEKVDLTGDLVNDVTI